MLQDTAKCFFLKVLPFGAGGSVQSQGPFPAGLGGEHNETPRSATIEPLGDNLGQFQAKCINSYADFTFAQ